MKNMKIALGTILVVGILGCGVQTDLPQGTAGMSAGSGMGGSFGSTVSVSVSTGSDGVGGTDGCGSDMCVQDCETRHYQ